MTAAQCGDEAKAGALDTRRAKVYAANTGHEAAKRIVYVPTYLTNTVVASEVKSASAPSPALTSRTAPILWRARRMGDGGGETAAPSGGVAQGALMAKQ